MEYQISEYSLEKAKTLGVELRPSNTKMKTIDIYKNDEFVCSIGNKRYLDFPALVDKFGMNVACDKRREYKIRHKYSKGEVAFFTNKIIW